jgi:peptidoglycan/LPS O-acetylase OafA/YrhL
MTPGIAAEPAIQTSSPALTWHRTPLKALTGIRFVAAYYVVFFHTRLSDFFAKHGVQPLANFIRNGYLAVPFFFILSGLILAYTYQGQIEKPGDHRRFWEARFARIWPVYVVSLIAATIPGFVFPSLGAAVASFLMVQAWNPFKPELAATFNMMCWSLSVEALFYVVFPWAQVWIEKLSQRKQLGFLAAMLVLCLLVQSTSRTVSTTQYGVWAYIPLPIFHLPEFLTGVALGNYFLGRRMALRDQPGPRGVLAGEGFFALGSGLWTYASLALTIILLCRPALNPTSSLIVAAFASLLFGLAAETTLLSRFLSTPAMLLGGAISYSVYLIQLPVKQWVLAAAAHVHFGSETTRMLITAIVLPLVAYVTFTVVEDPARKFLRGAFARSER